ncbi:MAG: bifunctional DNA-formamidopyrimidine glycosylase/DNA-(apurinic or apyrimidinic site) lyase [Candidatus Pacebacteria bacterium]|nr:bifunctional DNA-formamidopyrimidine glycosylase/DNA-(apurinic or apyrimidinic site) lyase [Candidatus Paceibacterota bacterium]
MPELPEVETVVRKLRNLIVDKKISNIEVLNSKSFTGDISKLIGSTVIDVRRRAKIINIVINDDLYLLTHLKMTGQYILQDGTIRAGGGHPSSDWVNNLPSRHTRVVFHFQDGSKLFFNDMRKFGWIRQNTKQQLEQSFAKLGPDVIEPELTYEYLKSQLQRRTIPIKQAIMMNEILCGVGNIYACDSLNDAKISPFRPAKSISDLELKNLILSMKKIVNMAIDKGGTTFDGMYVDVDGLAGSYQDSVLTYGREGKNCYNCGSLIKKDKLGGRGTYYCPTCQK